MACSWEPGSLQTVAAWGASVLGSILASWGWNAVPGSCPRLMFQHLSFFKSLVSCKGKPDVWPAWHCRRAKEFYWPGPLCCVFWTRFLGPWALLLGRSLSGFSLLPAAAGLEWGHTLSRRGQAPHSPPLPLAQPKSTAAALGPLTVTDRCLGDPQPLGEARLPALKAELPDCSVSSFTGLSGRRGRLCWGCMLDEKMQPLPCAQGQEPQPWRGTR